MFKDNETAEHASRKLTNEGFEEENITVFRFRNGNSEDTETKAVHEDEETGGFWDWVFGDDKETRAKYSAAGASNTVVTVISASSERANDAKPILDDMGAIDVHEEYENAHGGTLDNQRNMTDENDEVIPVIKESIAVGKRNVETGGVKVRSAIIERPVEEHIRLHKERVHVSRKPVDRAVDATDAFQEKSIEMTEHSEEAVIEKTARVVEEITVGKEVREQDETITDTVRETEIEIDDSHGDSTEKGFEVAGFDRNRSKNVTSSKVFGKNRIDRAFSDVHQANRYYDFLPENGYSTDEITVMMSKDTKEEFYAENSHIEDTGDSALKGAGTGGAIGGTVGAVVGALTKAGMSDDVAAEYNDAIKDGDVIVSVEPKDLDNDDRSTSYQYGRDMYNGHQSI